MINETYNVKIIPTNEVKTLLDIEFNELSYQRLINEIESKIITLRATKNRLLADDVAARAKPEDAPQTKGILARLKFW